MLLEAIFKSLDGMVLKLREQKKKKKEPGAGVTTCELLASELTGKSIVFQNPSRR